MKVHDSGGNLALSCRIDYDARLVEEAVLLRMASHPEEARFRKSRNPIYEVVDSEQREKRFREFHSEWFVRLRMGEPIVAALGEQPTLGEDVLICCVVRALSSYEEGADLHQRRSNGGVGEQGHPNRDRLRTNVRSHCVGPSTNEALSGSMKTPRQDAHMYASTLRTQTSQDTSIAGDSSKTENASNRAAAEKIIVVKLQPASFLNSDRLRAFLRHEFMHIVDMLDPRFGYQPVLPKSEYGPAYDHLVKDRYGVLWDTWIDGRLQRRGWAGGHVCGQRRAEFIATFPMCGDEVEEKFAQFFNADFLTHGALAAFALNPGGGSKVGVGRGRAQPCPLCRFPTSDFIDGTRQLTKEAKQQIAVDFPNWRPGHGLCRQCSDLYLARGLSQSAEAGLPGTQRRQADNLAAYEINKKA
ncbi:MAG: hypothetical protein HY645_05105 [Acidobacteria bacterium]|nr:hypothetical protein [Acidobacteriota bacterium]